MSKVKILHIGSDGWDTVRYGEKKYLYKRQEGYLIPIKEIKRGRKL